MVYVSSLIGPRYRLSDIFLKREKEREKEEEREKGEGREGQREFERCVSESKR